MACTKARGVSGAFTNAAPEEIARLAAEHPLVWIVPAAAPETALLMPVLLEYDAAGAPASVLGHLPRSGPAARTLAEHDRAHFLFLGPHGYVSPQVVSQEKWGPTWNFAAMRIEARVRLDPDLTAESVTKLAAHLEKGYANPWTPDEMGARFAQLTTRIIGFRADISAIAPRMKLGQDETAQSAEEIIDAFQGSPLADWMRRRRPGPESSG